MGIFLFFAIITTIFNFFKDIFLNIYLCTLTMEYANTPFHIVAFVII
jgi:hypothetical protein